LGVLGWQRVEERFAEVPVESLDFAFGLRSIRCTELNAEAAMLGEVQELAIVFVLTVIVGVAFDDDGLRIVAEYVEGNAAKPVERAFQARNERFSTLVVSELDKWIA
jgi:hypothetical protein